MKRFNAAFRRWFGDSKVVDANGQPLVVYHGTEANFTAFDLAQSSAYGSSGLHFSSEEANAAFYGDRIMSVYLQIHNPLRFGELSDYFPRHYSEVNRLAQAIISGHTEQESLLSFGVSPGMVGEYLRQADGRPVDGIIIEGADWEPGRGNSDQYIVFSPAQIKSIHNQGTWSRTDPDIQRNPSTAEMAVATATARAAGAVGRRALVPRRVLEIARPGQSILDFGAGP